MAREVSERFRSSGADIVLATGSMPVAMLPASVPFAFYADATFASYLKLYLRSEKVCKRSVREGMALDRLAIQRARVVFYASEWAARSAMLDYGVDPSKVHVVPFGANLDDPPTDEIVGASIRDRSVGVVELLFVAVDWERKGGDVALLVVEELQRVGVKARLTVVGCEPPPQARTLPFVHCTGFLDKRSSEQAGWLNALYSRSHFFIMPSRAEAFGVVFCEAAAWGVPSLGSNVGGIPSAIIDRTTGRVFEPDSFVEDCAAYIKSIMENAGTYRDLAWAARVDYRSRLNWGTSAREVVRILRGIG
jgi:glycosyltransferase involved in cell wall biosynthesis